MRRRSSALLLALAAVVAACGRAGAPPIDVAARAVPTIPPTTTTTTTVTTTTMLPTTTTAPRPAPTAAPRPRTATTRPPLVAAPASSKTGVVAAFSYAWYHGAIERTRFHPTLNPQETLDPATIKKHIDQMRYGGIQAGIASWWGHPDQTDEALALQLKASEGTPFKWSLYYEREGDQFPNASVEELRGHLQYLYDHHAGHPNFLKMEGKPVVFVWPDPTDRCDMVTRWKQANTMGFHVVQKRFPGSTGCLGTADSWHDYSPDKFSIEVRPWSYSVGPGFHKWDESPRLARNPTAFESAVRSMAASPAMWKLVTTFNEWHEGTAIEPAAEWSSPSGYGVYLDILHSVLGSY